MSAKNHTERWGRNVKGVNLHAMTERVTRQKTGLWFLSLLFLGALWGCDETGCFTDRTNLFVVEFYDATGANLQQVGFASVHNADSTLIFAAQDTTGRLVLALDPVDTSSFFVLTSSLGQDTLWLRYNLRRRLLDPECGVEVIYSEMDTLKHTFDSLVFDQTDLRITHERNIRILQ